jgi:hypothetical protein
MKPRGKLRGFLILHRIMELRGTHMASAPETGESVLFGAASAQNGAVFGIDAPLSGLHRTAAPPSRPNRPAKSAIGPFGLIKQRFRG